MTVEIYVVLRRERMPTTGDWQRALDQMGLDLRLDPDVDPISLTGYWPATLGGADSGFEYFGDPSADVLDDDVRASVGDRDWVAFVTPADLLREANEAR